MARILTHVLTLQYLLTLILTLTNTDTNKSIYRHRILRVILFSGGLPRGRHRRGTQLRILHR